MKTTKQILWGLVTTGLLAVPFISFIVATSMYFPFIVGKGFTFRILVEIIFGLYLILAFLAPEYRPKMSWISKSVLAFTLVVLLADIFAVNPYKSFWSNYERMEGFVLIAHLFLFYVVASSVWNSKWWHGWFDVSILASVFMSIYGIAQLTGKITINQGGIRLDATLGNASYLAIYFVFHIFLCLYLFFVRKEYWQRVIYGAVVILESVMLYYTATRGAILGLIGGLILSAILVIFQLRTKPAVAVKESLSSQKKDNPFQKDVADEQKKVLKISYIFVGVILALILGFMAVRNASFVKNSPVLSRFSTLGPAEIVTQGRYYVWPMAIKGFVEKPILGWGQENFNFVFNKYYNPAMYNQEQWFDRTHDIFLDWLIAGGILGLLSYLSMYLALIWLIWKKGNFSYIEKSLFTGMIAAYFFHNIFVFDNLISYILFFSVLAFVHSKSVENVEPVGSFYKKSFSSDVIYYVVMPFTIILTAGAIYFVNVPAISANTDIIQGMMSQDSLSKNLDYFKDAFAQNSFGSSEALEQLIQSANQIAPNAQLPMDIRNNFASYADQEIKNKLAKVPNDARYLYFAASFYQSVGQYDKAVEYINKVLEINPNKETILWQLTGLYLGRKDYAKALDVARRTYGLATSSTQSQELYLMSAIYAGDKAGQAEMFAVIPKDSIVSNDRILQTYIASNNYDVAIDILNERLTKDPKNTQAELYLSYVYAKSGNKPKGVEIIQNMISADPTFKEKGLEIIKQLQTL